MILDRTLKDGEIKIYKDLGNGWVEDIDTNKILIEQLHQKNKQLKDNWDYIKKMLKEARQEEFNIEGYCGTCTDVDIDFLLNKMKELEKGNINE